MDQVFGFIFLAYMVSASIMLPIFGIPAAVQIRDCRIIAQEECMWVAVPVSEAPQDQRSAALNTQEGGE